jgi:large subunit ribosomal protein L25
MKSISINGTRRAAQTKQETKQLRAEGKIPCVLYGGKDQVHFSAPVLALKPLVYSPAVYTVDLDIEGATHKAVMKDIQFHPVNDKLLHIDFMMIADDKKVVMDIPVRITGSAVGVRQGGTLRTKMRMLKVRSLPKDLPDEFVIKVDDLDIGDSVFVRDMKLNGVEFLDRPNNAITAVKVTRVVVEEVAAAAATTAVAPGAEGAAAPAAGAPAADAKGAAPAKGDAKAAPAKEEKKK